MRVQSPTICTSPRSGPGPQRDFVLAFRNITIEYDAQQGFVFKRELVVAIWRVSTVQQTIEKVAENNTGEPLAAVGIAAGITLDGRPLILVSSRSGEALFPPPKQSWLIDKTFQLISDSDGRGALIRTGEVHDDAYEYVFSTAPVALEPRLFAKAVGHDSNLGIVAFTVSDLSATLVRPLAEAAADEVNTVCVKAVNSDEAIVALVNGSGYLELIGWQLAASDFAVRRMADGASGFRHD